MIYPAINPYVVISEQAGVAIDTTTGRNVELPKGAYPILRLVDGKTDIDTIVEKIMGSYVVSQESLHNFFNNMSKMKFLTLSSTPYPRLSEKKPPIGVASIELTEKCNLKCRYCYGAFAPERSTHLTYEDAVKLFGALKARNVRTVELTGGEPTVNPFFDKILEEACRLFRKVTIMTNAVVLRSSTLDIYKKYQDKVGFSISIDGFSETTNDFQRGVSNTFRHTLNNIICIKKAINPSYFRVVYMLTNENVNEVDDFFDCMLSSGIQDVVVSIPENIEKGRTYKLADGCIMSDRKSRIRGVLDAKAVQLGKKYLKKVHTVIDRLGTKGIRILNALPSCGAGWTMLSFQANGNVQPCNMMGTEWKLGNFKKDPSLDFLSLDNPLYAAFSSLNLSTDNGNRVECKDCQYNDFCGKCINKIFMANQDRIAHGKEICPILQKTNIPKELFLHKS